MKYFKLITPILLSVSLCACGTPKTVSVVQPITVQNITPTNIAKNEPTTIQPKDTPIADLGTVTEPQAEKSTTSKSKGNASSNSAVKDVIIDGNGNLVVSHSNGTFSSFAPIPGPAGAIGPKGDKGDKGADGIDGKDGRGIDHCELTEDNHLIVYYTDNTTQDVGALSFQIPNQEVPDYEKVGYVLSCEVPTTSSGHYNAYGEKWEYEYSSISIKLISIDKTTPTTKYKYQISGHVECHSEVPYQTLPFIHIELDSYHSCSEYIEQNLPTSSNMFQYYWVTLNKDLTDTFILTTPVSKITNIYMKESPI